MCPAASTTPSAPVARSVNPGDLVVGDADGVVVIEREKAPAMMALADKKVADEAARIESIARGDTAAKWLPAALRAAGVLKERGIAVSQPTIIVTGARAWRNKPSTC